MIVKTGRKKSLQKPSECNPHQQQQTTTSSLKMIPKEIPRRFLHSERTIELLKSFEIYELAKQTTGICSVALYVKESIFTATKDPMLSSRNGGN